MSMYCTTCGKKIPDTVDFCTFCGARQKHAAPAAAPAARPRPRDPIAVPRIAIPAAASAFFSSFTLPEMLIALGSLLAIVGFFLPAWSLTSFTTTPAPTPLYDPGNTWASGAPNLGSTVQNPPPLTTSTTSTVSLLSLTHSGGAFFLILLLALAAIGLVFLSRQAARTQKILVSSLQLAIGSMIGPASLLALLFLPSVRTPAAFGFWVLSLGYCAIAAGGLLAILQLSKSPS